MDWPVVAFLGIPTILLLALGWHVDRRAAARGRTGVSGASLPDATRLARRNRSLDDVAPSTIDINHGGPKAGGF